MNAPAQTTTASPSRQLPIDGLEKVYDRLATALDQAGDKSELFLVKLALLNANTLADAGLFEAHVAAALEDL